MGKDGRKAGRVWPDSEVPGHDAPCLKGEQGSNGSGTDRPRHDDSSIGHVSSDSVPRPERRRWDYFSQRVPSCQLGPALPT